MSHSPPAATPDVAVLDATLRLGSQGTGFRPGLGDALAVLRLLDELGVAYAEIGAPGDSPRDATLAARVARDLAPRLTLVAHATAPLGDAALRGVLASGAEVVTLSVTAAAPRVAGGSPAEHLAAARRAIGALVGEGRRVLVDAEHAVDGLAADAGYAREVLALEAAAVTVCDTLGGAMPWQVAAAVETARESAAVVGVQCRDDAGCAVAGTLAAVRAGARLVTVTANGYGSRCGAADLAAVVAGIETKLGLTALPAGGLAHLQRVAHAIAETANLAPDPAQPYVGTHAFAGPVQHVEPAAVGNAPRAAVSGAAGRAGVERAARAAGVELPPDMAGRIAEVVRANEARGYSYEAAEASFELLLRTEVDGAAPRVFELESWRVIVERRADGELVSEATVKLHAGGRRLVATGEGNGPVNALDTAIRSALGDSHPALARLELVDYKVRILDGGHGTGAVTRVLVTTSDGEREWVTVGAGENVIDASWQALDDAVRYGLSARRD